MPARLCSVVWLAACAAASGTQPDLAYPNVPHFGNPQVERWTRHILKIHPGTPPLPNNAWLLAGPLASITAYEHDAWEQFASIVGRFIDTHGIPVTRRAGAPKSDAAVGPDEVDLELALRLDHLAQLAGKEARWATLRSDLCRRIAARPSDRWREEAQSHCPQEAPPRQAPVKSGSAKS